MSDDATAVQQRVTATWESAMRAAREKTELLHGDPMLADTAVVIGMGLLAGDAAMAELVATRARLEAAEAVCNDVIDLGLDQYICYICDEDAPKHDGRCSLAAWLRITTPAAGTGEESGE